MKISTPLTFVLLATTLASCEFRRPAEGYDPDWQPDHEVPARPDAPAPAEMERPGTDDHGIPSAASSSKRPADVIADTAGMKRAEGSWEEAGEVASGFTVYSQNGKPAMIIEVEGNVTRTYYYDAGTLFYYNEQSASGGYELTVEFDDIGDVIGARRTLNGERIHVDEDDLSAVVEHAVELQIAARDLQEEDQNAGKATQE